MLSQMSVSDLQQYGSLIGLPCLDSANSMKYTAATGLQNNFVFGNFLHGIFMLGNFRFGNFGLDNFEDSSFGFEGESFKTKR